MALASAMASDSNVEMEKKGKKSGKLKDDMWRALATAFLCDIVVFSEENRKQYKANMKIFTKPFYILRGEDLTYILYPIAFAKEFIEGTI